MYQSRHFWPSHSPCQVLVQHARCRHSICTFDRWNQQNPSCTSLLLSWCSCQLPEASNCHLSTYYLSLSAPWLLLHWLAVWLSHSNQLNLKNEYSFRIENGQWSVLWTTMEKIKVQISYLHTHHITNNVNTRLHLPPPPPPPGTSTPPHLSQVFGQMLLTDSFHLSPSPFIGGTSVQPYLSL